MTDTTKTSPKAPRAKRFARQPAETGAPETIAPESNATPAPAKVNKTELVLDLLRREEGATLAEITEGTGWLPHSARAALTGLRKKSHAIEKSKRGDVTCYSILTAAA